MQSSAVPPGRRSYVYSPPVGAALTQVEAFLQEL